MQVNQSTNLLIRLIGFFLLAFAAHTSAWADMQKFIYVFDADGSLLAPSNAAEACPSPNDSSIINACHGVKVAQDGSYNIELPSDTITSSDQLMLVAKTFERIAANSQPDLEHDTYIETKSKRRLEKIKRNKHNKGVDINELSEVGVKAVEDHFNIRLADSDGESLADIAPNLDADLLNAAMGNSKADNDIETTADSIGLGLKASNLNLFDDDDEATLLTLASLAVEHQGNEIALGVIRKNISQGLINPELFDETSERILSQVEEISTRASDSPMVMLDADRYVAHVDQVVNLSTDNSLNPDRFFGYTWMGVESDTSKAQFSRSEPGSYLVCVTGEIDSGNDSSSDCVRLEIKPISYAVITAHPLRIKTGEDVHLSAFYSVGAESYQWVSDHGVFEDATAMETLWTAPSVKGAYEISLTINDDETDSVSIEVYDVLPIAKATTDKELIYLDDENSTAVLTSSSITTNNTAVDSIEWQIIEQPADSTAALSNSNRAVSHFSSDTQGDYLIRLTANKDGLSDSTELKIQVRQRGIPVADAGPDLITFRNQTVRLDGRGSHDLDGLPISYSWNSAGGQLINADEALATFSSDELGTYRATLNVNNGSHDANDDATITVRNRLPLASDDFYNPLLGELAAGYLHAFDSDGDLLSYTLLTEPENGGVTIDPETGEFIYVPAGPKGCKYHPGHKPNDNHKGGKDVPVIKLCADKFVVNIGDTVTLTTSNSINATKLQGFHWIGVDSTDTTATFVATEAGIHHICVVGNIGNSSNTSTACVDITVKEGAVNGDDNPDAFSEGFVDSFQFLVNDGYGNSNIATVVLRVGWENTPPVIDDLSLSVDEDVLVNGTLSGNDIDNQLLIFSVLEQGDLGTLTLNDSASGNFTYTPNQNAFGTDTIKVRAFDGHDYSATGTVTVTISGFNDLPIAFDGNLTTDEDTAIIAAQLSAEEPDGEALTFSIVSNGSIGSAVLTDSANGTINYIPNANAKGNDHITFLVNDGNDNSNIATVNINVQAINDAPTAADLDRIFTEENDLISGTLDAEDIDLDFLTYRLLSTGTLGTAVITNPLTGAFTYTPNTDVNGSDTISYVASDGSVDSNIAFVPITITPNEPPVAADMSLSTDHLTTLEDTLGASDPEGKDITYEIVSDASKGTVQLLNLGTGAFRYVPDGSVGVDSFTYLARDEKSASNIGTVTIAINEFNNAPVANEHSFTAFEGVPYSGQLTGSDTEGSALTFAISVNGRLGNASFDNASTGQFTYTSFNGRFGAEYYNFTVSDGDMISADAKVSANIISHADACRGPQAPGYDADGDGYADIVELAFSTDHNDAAQTPASLNPEDYSVNFADDDDSDGFSDHVELWLGSDPNDNTSVPTDSLNKAVPSCVSGGADYVAPALLAFDILTPVVTIADNSSVASFALTAMDNSSGVKDVTVVLSSPSGQEVRAIVNQETPSTMLYLNFDSEVFSLYAEAGIWKVTELTLGDAAGNVRTLGTEALEEHAFPTDLEVINANSDIGAADLLDFVILTPSVDLADPDPKASFTVSASDSPAGIQRINVTLRSPTGTSFRWGEMVDNAYPTSFNGQIDSNSFDSYAETGTWTVSELAIIDAAGNALRLNTTALTDLGFSTTVDVINGLADTSLPLLDDFQILTPEVYPATGEAMAQYSVTASDADSGIDSIEVMLVSPTGAESMQAVFSSPSSPASIQATMQTNLFNQIAEAGLWQVSYVVVTDSANNRALFSTADLTDNGYDTTVELIYLGGAGINTAPVAYGDHISLDEDTTYDGQLNAYDADGHELSFHLDTPAANGSVSIDATTGQFNYTPEANFFGSDAFSFKVDDGYTESNAATISITVNPINDAPVSEDLSIVVTANTTYIDLLEATDVDGDTLIFNIIDNGSSGSASFTDINSGDYQFVPNLDALGDDSFTFTVSDGIESAGPYTVSVDIQPDLWVVDFNVLTPTVTNKDQYVTVGAEVTFNKPAVSFGSVRIELYGPSGQLIPYAVAVSPTSPDAIVLSTLVDTHSINFEAGNWIYRNVMAQELDKATVVVQEDLIGAGFDATVRVADNLLPSADDASITTQKNMPYFGNLVADDPDGDPLTYSIVEAPSLGSVELDSDSGAFTYTPPAHALGSDSFSFKANDGFNDSNIATVNITIIEPDGVPVAYNTVITVFRNTPYGGNLLGLDPDGDSLSFHLDSAASLGSVSINSATGAYVYTPNANLSGSDSFTFYVSDGRNNSAVATVNIDVLHEDQVCHYGDTAAGIDNDGDGYANVVEVAFGTDMNDDSSTPEGMNADDLGISFMDDDDADSFPDFVEIWMGSDPSDDAAKPTDSTLGLLPPCFDSGSDGIKPRLLSFDISTPVVDISGGDGFASYSMTLIDNASGVRRVRIDLLSPSGAYHTTSISFDDYPVVRGLTLDSNTFSEFAEQGIWQISGITLYDEAGNKRSLNSDELTEAGFPTEVDLSNLNSDNNAPTLDGFSVITPDVDPLGGTAVVSFQLHASDDIAGLNTAVISLTSPAGVVVEAVGSFVDTPTSVNVQIDTPTLSSFAEQGAWTITSLLLTDAAGNTAQYADQLTGLGYASTVSVVNTGGDGVKPTLKGLTILTPEVYPAGGDARMSFMVSALDDVAGIEKIRIDLQGPNGQYLAAWGYFFDTTPLSASAQINTAVLSDLTQEGHWTITEVEIYDVAGNSSRIDSDELSSFGYSVTVTVMY